MGQPPDDADRTKERQSVRDGWEHLRQHELEMVQMLHTKADEEQAKAQRLRAEGDIQGAEAAERQVKIYLKEADDMVLDAMDALRRKGDLDNDGNEG